MMTLKWIMLRLFQSQIRSWIRPYPNNPEFVTYEALKFPDINKRLAISQLNKCLQILNEPPINFARCLCKNAHVQQLLIFSHSGTNKTRGVEITYIEIRGYSGWSPMREISEIME